MEVFFASGMVNNVNGEMLIHWVRSLMLQPQGGALNVIGD
jgi:hypothetical protein